jgi:hypothetical protein
MFIHKQTKPHRCAHCAIWITREAPCIRLQFVNEADQQRHFIYMHPGCGRIVRDELAIDTVRATQEDLTA